MVCYKGKEVADLNVMTISKYTVERYALNSSLKTGKLNRTVGYLTILTMYICTDSDTAQNNTQIHMFMIIYILVTLSH